MNIGVDIDDVLAEFQIAWLDYHNKKYGTGFTKEDITSYDFRHIFKEDIDVLIQRVMDFYDTPGFANLNPSPYSKKYIKAIIKDHNLFAITSRPDKTKENTLDWLDKHFGNIFSKIVLTNEFSNKKAKRITKLQVCQANNIGLMIEDCLEKLNTLAQNDIRGVLIDKPWNKADQMHKNIARVASWREIPDLISLV